MADLGSFALILCLFLSVYAVLIDIFGIWYNRIELNKSADNATIATFGCLTITVVILWIMLLKSDFSIDYVVEHTSKTLPLLYKVSALWAGAAGSLLLWLWLQVGFAVLAFRQGKSDQRTFLAHARVVINLVSVFFLIILIRDKKPFDLSPVIPTDGAGLNPLLQHPAMALHPPTLFIGYAAFAIPFAWAFASLKWDNNKGNIPYLRQTRIWTLAAWLFLTIGIALGAWWAYEELGWGGYWAWDPVENSSLMPWLTGTALLHCFLTYRKNTSIVNWLIILCLGTFSLCIFGTFLTRYGLVSSVHAFPNPGLGILFIVLLLLLWIIAGILALLRYRQSTTNVSKVATKSQKVIALNSWLMVLLMFVIFVGTLFPFFSGLVGNKISLKPEYFTKITAPGGLLLLLLLGICPYLVRHGINKNWRIIGGLTAGLLALTGWLLTDKIAPAVFILCGFAALNITADLINKAVKSKSVNPNLPKTSLNLRWYGARIVHIGVVMTFLGIAGSSGYGYEEQVALKQNIKTNVAGYDIAFEGFRTEHGPNFTSVSTDIIVEKDGKLVARLNPSQAVYSDSGKRTSEVDIKRSLVSDLYLALNEVDIAGQLITLSIMVKPLVNWIWIGCVFSILGTIIVLASFYQQKKAPSGAERSYDNE